jgi:hypothetical protein
MGRLASPLKLSPRYLGRWRDCEGPLLEGYLGRGEDLEVFGEENRTKRIRPIKLARKEERMRWWVTVAPLGELPKEEELVEMAKTIWFDERRYRARTLLRGKRERDVEFLREFLDGVRGSEGVFIDQVDGGGVAKRYVREHGPASLSALVGMGVHADRSVYVLSYERTQTDWEGNPPDLTRQVAKAFAHPDVRRELEALEERLSREYPALATLRKTEPLHLVTAKRRGQVVFLLDPLDMVRGLIVGETVLFFDYPQDERKLHLKEETLVRWLREKSALRALSPKAIKALLRGEGDVKEAERSLALVRLSEF